MIFVTFQRYFLQLNIFAFYGNTLLKILILLLLETSFTVKWLISHEQLNNFTRIKVTKLQQTYLQKFFILQINLMNEIYSTLVLKTIQSYNVLYLILPKSCRYLTKFFKKREEKRKKNYVSIETTKFVHKFNV